MSQIERLKSLVKRLQYLRLITFILLALFCNQSIANAASCLPEEHWVRPHHRSGYVRWDGVSVAPAEVSGHCSSNQATYKAWGNSFRGNLPKLWPHTSELAKPWKEDERERVLSVLAKLPKPFSSIVNVKFYRAGSSKTKLNPATSAKETIVLYDDAFKEDRVLARVLLHELAHELYRGLDDINRTLHNHASGWTQKFGKWKFDNRKVVIEDSNVSPEESFANAIEYLFFEPTRLKYKDPSLFDWLTINYPDRMNK